jgi:hypothetical protein
MKAAIYARYSVVTIALATLLAFPLLSCASDKNGRYLVSISKSHHSCGQYISARNERSLGDFMREDFFRAWLHGYVTAYDFLKTDTYDILGSTDTDSALLWLEQYCRKNPHDEFANAAEALMIELYPKRIRQDPKGN